MNRLLIFCGLLAMCGLVITADNSSSETTSTPTTSISAIVSIITTPSSETTTNSSNVTTTTTSTSTIPPTTEPTPVPTTLAPPTLPPSPVAPTTPWNVSYSGVNGTVCILAEFALTLRIEYNSTAKDNITGFNLPPDASVDPINSYCNNITQVLSLNFNIINQTNGNITLTFNQTKDGVFVEKIRLVYNLTEDLFPNYFNKTDYGKLIIIENDGLNLFNVDNSHSYRCHSQTATQLDNSTQLDFSSAKVQAYVPKTNTNGHYSDESVCKQDNSTEISDAVPIAVGASLGALVLIVLIAYFIGRRRSRRMAYTSV